MAERICLLDFLERMERDEPSRGLWDQSRFHAPKRLRQRLSTLELYEEVLVDDDGRVWRSENPEKLLYVCQPPPAWMPPGIAEDFLEAYLRAWSGRGVGLVAASVAFFGFACLHPWWGFLVAGTFFLLLWGLNFAVLLWREMEETRGIWIDVRGQALRSTLAKTAEWRRRTPVEKFGGGYPLV